MNWRFLSAGMALAGMVAGRAADPLDTWTRADFPAPAPYRVAQGGGRFVAAGPAATLISTNGIQWTRLTTGTGGDVQALGFGRGRFTAVGGWPGSIRVSEDGVRWEDRASVETRDDILQGVGFGPDRAVAVGRLAGAWSDDGLQWNRVAQPGDLYAVVHAGGLWVAVGYSNEVYTSADGIDWVARYAGEFGSGVFYGVAHGNGRFVATGSGRGPENSVLGFVATSVDGVEWTAHSLPGYTGFYTPTIHAEGVFATCASGFESDGSSAFVAVVTSADGVTWTQRHRIRYPAMGGGYHGFTGLASDGVRLVALGNRDLGGMQMGAFTLASGDIRPPVISRIERMSTGSVRLEFTGGVGREVAVEAADVLGGGWTRLGLLTLPTSGGAWTGPDAGSGPGRFFRLAAP